MKASSKSNPVREVARALERLAVARGDAILVALSGGADSVALLHALHALRRRFGYRLAAAHLNHRLRGPESNRDETFVRELCVGLGVRLAVERARHLSAAASNLEERARQARYGFLRRAAAQLGCSHIATAHHADDQAETVMLRLLRGAGAAGLAAIAESTAGHGNESQSRGLRDPVVIRPMLRVRRDEILAYLDSIGARFVTDSTNAHPGFLRNRVRIELLPIIERGFAPGLRRRLAALADEMRELDDFVAGQALAELRRRRRHDGALNLEGFAALHRALAAALLRAFVADRAGTLRRISRRHIDDLRQLCMGEPPSAAIDLPDGWRAERRYGVLALDRRSDARAPTRRASDGFEIRLAGEGTTTVRQANFTFHSSIIAADAAPLPSDLFEACFDAGQADSALAVRNFRRGDRIFPLGMDGSRKLHDVFVDRKLVRARRANYPVVTLGGEVAWVPGMVRAKVALVGPSTRLVVRLSARENLFSGDSTRGPSSEGAVACEGTRMIRCTDE